MNVSSTYLYYLFILWWLCIYYPDHLITKCHIIDRSGIEVEVLLYIDACVDV